MKTQIFIRSPNERPITQFTSKRKIQSILGSNTPPFQDRVVQEVLLMILEPVFEPKFSSKSHAFRPGRNAHTVIRTIRSNFAGYLWFVKGDLSGILDNIGANVVMGYVAKGVRDRKLLSLIKSALGGPERNRVQHGEDVKRSPMLANVCLNELDHMMEERIVAFFRPCRFDSIWKDSLNDGCHSPSWPEFVPASGREKTRKMDYIRFGGHFLIGIRGPREDAVEIRKGIIEFCDGNYGLRLDNTKVEIEHISRGIQFLDHIICRRVISPTLRYTATGGKIFSERGVGTLLSVTASLQQCIRQFRQLKFVKGDRDPEPLPCTPMLYSGQAHTNSQMNKFLETMADWYRYADSRKKIVGFCAYVVRSSLAKLYAARYRLKSRAKVYGIASRDLSGPLRESSNNAAPEYSDLLRMGLVDAIEGVQFSHMSSIPSCDYTPFPRKWVPDHERVLREYIRLQDPKLFCELHRSIKRRGLSLPQDEISDIVWDYKTLGVRSYMSNSEKETKNASEEVMLPF
ncbi:hypothetical protein RJ639_006303 [Escallonia herrerae]|uniref:Domain X domain-containing protein n=1 Tax=Escallonia herrerae TaxID=1293975 RepID=A0AA88VXX0_9ASTE|nr:hypothetical protein RJ639_006303 [Escallonia herrerae]